jgi:hypothetical protein
MESGQLMPAIEEYERLIQETGRKSFHYNISYIYSLLMDRW